MKQQRRKRKVKDHPYLRIQTPGILVIMGDLQEVRRKMLRILSDGELHPREELHACLMDNSPETAQKTMGVHFCYIRKVIRPLGLDIMKHIERGRFFYRLVVTLSQPISLH